MKIYYRLITSIFITIVLLFIEPILNLFTDYSKATLNILDKQIFILVTIGVSWVLIEFARTIRTLFLDRFDISKEDDLTSRRAYTQISLLEKVIIFIIVLFAIGIILMSFDGIRKFGIGLFASAGFAGIILGISAQKVIGSLLAGIQIAITQPVRIGDTVLVENEWGWIEEINLTYVVVKVWDKRRLVLPSTYFLDKPFQNWTRKSAEIIGHVLLYVDYSVSFPALRAELTRLLNESKLWDRNINTLQVTDSKESTIEIRILVSARNAGVAWELKVYIREKMIEFIQENYPESLPKTRIALEKDKTGNANQAF